jgi:hypothetical protein
VKCSRLIAVAVISLIMLTRGGVPVSAQDKSGKEVAKPKQEQSMKEDAKDVGRAVKKDSKTAGHDIKNGFEDIGPEVKGMCKKK